MMTYRTATLPDLERMLEWAAEEGWNPGWDDAQAFYKADPNGFFVATDPSGTPVGAICVVNHTTDFAFLGLYIVRPDHRGKGIGLGLWRHAMAHAQNRTVGLDGVEAQQQNYVTSGFAHAGATKRFTGQIEGVPHPRIRKIASSDVPVLIQREAAASGVSKPNYLAPWFEGTSQRITITHEDGGGFCTIRACRTGAKIGPLVAENSFSAQQLITHAASLFKGPVTLDVPDTATGLAALCKTFGFEPGFRTARMYRGPFSSIPHPFFAVVSLELG